MFRFSVARLNDEAQAVAGNFRSVGGRELRSIVRFEVNHLVDNFFQKDDVHQLLAQDDTLVFRIVESISFFARRPLTLSDDVDILCRNLKIVHAVVLPEQVGHSIRKTNKRYFVRRLFPLFTAKNLELLIIEIAISLSAYPLFFGFGYIADDSFEVAFEFRCHGLGGVVDFAAWGIQWICIETAMERRFPYDNELLGSVNLVRPTLKEKGNG